MNKTKFTKGPWVVNDGFKSNFLRGKITAEIKNNDVVIVDTPSFYFGQAVAVANANLITCAPDMYKHIEEDIEILQRQAKQYVFGSCELRAINLRIETKQKLLKRARGE